MVRGEGGGGAMLDRVELGGRDSESGFSENLR